MIKVTVTNSGSRVVSRFGVAFEPGVSVDLELIAQRQVLALQAVRTLEVVVHEQEPQVIEDKQDQEPIEVQSVVEAEAPAAPKPQSKKSSKKQDQ
jgi:hypothetical protein